MEDTRDGLNSQQWEVSDGSPKLLSPLALRVRRVSERPIWEWELVDEREGSLFEKAFPYESLEDARTAGLARLAELTAASPEATTSAGAAGMPSPRHVIIVSRDHGVLHGVLRRLFEDGEGIEVVEDRRRHHTADRNATDRRASVVEIEAQGPGWWMIRRVPMYGMEM